MTDNHGTEQGAAAIETAMIIGVLLLLTLGAFEWGMALRDWMTVSSATREGARVAASAADFSGADCLILEATSGALQNISADSIVEIWIYRSDTSGAVLNTQRYRPKSSSDTQPIDLDCTVGWYRNEDGYPSSARDNDNPPLDWVGVRLIFEHEWQTGFLWFTGTAQWEEDTVMRIEPGID
jgi:hypothetical protein